MTLYQNTSALFILSAQTVLVKNPRCVCMVTGTTNAFRVRPSGLRLLEIRSEEVESLRATNIGKLAPLSEI